MLRLRDETRAGAGPEEACTSLYACVGGGLRAGLSWGLETRGLEGRLVGGPWRRNRLHQLSVAGAGPAPGRCGGATWRVVPLVGVRRRAPLVGRRWGRAMALLLCLGLSAVLARGCLHCHRNSSEKFSFYRHHVNLKSWWVGDIPVSGSLLTNWSQDTMKELHLAIPAEISECRGSRPGAPLVQPDSGPAAHPPSRPAPSPGEAGPSGQRRIPEDGSAVPGEDVFPG